MKRLLAIISSVILVDLIISTVTGCRQQPFGTNEPFTRTVTKTELIGDAYLTSSERRVSPDCRHLAFISNRTITIDCVSGKQYDSVSLGVSFSSDSKHFAYVATSGDKQMVVVDGVEGKQYDEIDWGGFSPDGNRVAYFA